MDRILALVVTVLLLIAITSMININNLINSLDKKECCSCSIKFN